jgi:hypothetical protein
MAACDCESKYEALDLIFDTVEEVKQGITDPETALADLGLELDFAETFLAFFKYDRRMVG